MTMESTRMSRETLDVGVPKGSSAVVVISTAERVHAMSEALAGAAETFDGYRLGPAADAELRSALAAAPPSTTSRQRG